jgi:hypothetical protein
MATRLPRCINGTRRNPHTKLCEPISEKIQPVLGAVNITVDAIPLSVPMPPAPVIPIQKRCPAGSRRNKRTGICEPSVEPQVPSVQPVATAAATASPLIISFLFLTYGAIVHDQVIRNLTQNHRVYIHPKFPQLVPAHFRGNVIQHLIPNTAWGSTTIIDATINLLQTALIKGPDSQWFIFLSQDVYPAKTEPEICAYLSEQTLSIFHVSPHSGDANKASQWWILNRKDAKTIVNHHEVYKRLFSIPKQGAPDETYFLSCLRHANPNYRYTNRVAVYCQWLSHTIQKSPATFHRLTEVETNYIRWQGALFFRKTFDDFVVEPVPKQTTRTRTLVVVYVGTKSRQEYAPLCRLVDSGNIDVIVITAIPLIQINPELLRRCLCVHQIIWKFFVESVLNLTVGHCTTWRRICFLSETFRMEDIGTCRLPNTSLRRIADLRRLALTHPLPFEPLYVQLVDRGGNPAYLFANDRGSFISGELML